MSNFSIPILLLITIGIKGSQYLIRNYSKRNYILALLSISLILIVIAVIIKSSKI